MEEKKMIKRGGLQKRFYIIEPKLQPEDIVEKIGKEGKAVTLKSNYANFKLRPKGPFFMYDVRMNATKSLRGKLDLLGSVAALKGPDEPFCFDGRRLFTISAWHKEDPIEKFTVKEEEVSVRFITSFLQDTEEYYQMVNIIFNNVQSFMGQERIGRAFFLGSNCDAATSRFGPTFYKRDNFKILGGFSTTLTRGTNKDGSASTLLYLERINRVLNENSVYNIYNKNQLDMLIGRDVITKYNNKTYRISDVKEIDITDEIELNDAKISYADYFKQRYNITLNHARQPFVISRMRRIAIQRKENIENEPDAPKEADQSLSIPGELCFLCGFSDTERSNINLQKSLGSVLKREPRERLNDIKDFCSWTKEDKAEPYMKKWGVQIEDQPITIMGRELNGVEVFSNRQRINGKTPDDWKFGEVKFDVPQGAQHRFGILVVERNSSQFNQFIDDVKREMSRLRVSHTIETVVTCRANEVEDFLTDFVRVQKVHMALVFIGDDKVYARVKNFTISTGLLTQCVTVRNGTNRDDRRRKVVADKSVMQMFAKLGYDPWGVELKMVPTMVVGLDTFHSKTGKRSIQASVFSISHKFSQYLSFVNSPKGKNEYHENLSQNFTSAINVFKDKFKIMPQRFIIYRDGVGDSQLYFTKKYETEAVLKMMESVYEGKPLPQIIYVIVKKRISVKFFKDGDNPNPGTIVDEMVVKPNFYEFYLVSQRTTKGTATPTNYNVLMDTQLTNKSGEKAPLPPGQLQHITYALTHLYFNWMGTIRVPVPTHYAHRLAELVGTVHRGTNPPVISDRIRERLFYL